MAKLRERQAEMRERNERARKLHAELLTDLQQKNPDAEGLRKKFEEYRELRKDRQRDHRLQLHRRYRAALARPEIKAELERHARRSARLQRMSMLVATERKGAAREKLLDRLNALREQENKRHEQVMATAAPAPTAGGSAAPSVAPALAPAVSGGAP